MVEFIKGVSFSLALDHLKKNTGSYIQREGWDKHWLMIFISKDNKYLGWELSGDAYNPGGTDLFTDDWIIAPPCDCKPVI